MLDIYFDDSYGKLYEEIEHGEAVVYTFESQYGTIRHSFIKREIPLKVNNQAYYDIVTPYGYGGPIIIETIDEKKLVAEFEEEFNIYCKDNRIVSEFIRFHPMLNNAEKVDEVYNISHIRNTVGTNLKDFEDPFQSEFSKSCRKNVRKALKKDVDYKITESPNDIKSFLNIYYSTMDRNKAEDYYYFDESYFNTCLEIFKENILIVEAIYKEKTIAMGFYFIYNNYIHTHLSGTLSEYLHLSPAYVLRYALTVWGKDNGYEYIHHGGGTSNDPEDSLYKFKKQFGKHTEFEFYIGKRIWNKNIYNQLCKEIGVNAESDFFPAYRSK